MSSTGRWPDSSTVEAPPAGPGPGKRRPNRSAGADYLAAVSGPLDGLVHGDPWRPPRPYLALHALLRLLVRILFRYHATGQADIPAAPCIVASNHQAWYDALFIIAAFPARPMVYTMARRDTVFDRGWKRRLLPKFGVFPIQPFQGHLDEPAVATVYRLLGRGAVILIFPEGRYSTGREIYPLKAGIGHFALEAGVPICPVTISGIDRLRLFGRVEVTIRPAVWPDPPPRWTLRRRVLEMVDRVRRSIVHGFGDDSRAPRQGRLGRVGARLRSIRAAPVAWVRGRRGGVATAPPEKM